MPSQKREDFQYPRWQQVFRWLNKTGDLSFVVRVVSNAEANIGLLLLLNAITLPIMLNIASCSKSVPLSVTAVPLKGFQGKEDGVEKFFDQIDG